MSHQYGQFAIETTGKYSEKVSEIENFKQKIMEFPSISNIKQVVETDISWAGKNSTGKDQLSIITANDFASIQQFQLNQAIWITNSLFNLTRSLL